MTPRRDTQTVVEKVNTMTNVLENITGMHNASFGERMEVLKQLANQTGIRLPRTIIPEGESLIPYGEERKRALASEIAALPTMAEVANIIRAVQEEQAPRDVKVPMHRIRMDGANGGLFGIDQQGNRLNGTVPPLGYSPVAFDQTCQFLKPESVSAGFGPTLASLPVGIRADAFNHFAAKSVRRDVVLRTIRTAQRQAGELTLRRSMRAVVSERYSAVEDSNLCSDLNTILPDGAKARYTQTENRSDLEIIWPAMARELKVGDIALISLGVTNSQTKQASIRITPKVLRVLCLNFTTAYSNGADEEISIMHVGEARRKFASALRRALDVITPFVLAFGDAYNKPLPDTRGAVTERATKVLALPAKFAERIAGVWDADGSRSAGDTLAGLANAITRATQELPIERAEGIERSAGKIILQGWNALGY